MLFGHNQQGWTCFGHHFGVWSHFWTHYGHFWGKCVQNVSIPSSCSSTQVCYCLVASKHMSTYCPMGCTEAIMLYLPTSKKMSHKQIHGGLESAADKSRPTNHGQTASLGNMNIWCPLFSHQTELGGCFQGERKEGCQKRFGEKRRYKTQ